MSIKKILFGVIISVLIVSVAYVVGTEAGEYFQKQKRLEKRSGNTQSILSQMNDLKVGDKLQDYAFENLKFESVMLRPLVQQKTILFFIEPNCPACIEDMERLSTLVKTQQGASRFIIISSGNPRHLMDLRDDYALKSPILYDHERGYSSIFGVFTYPFHIVIDKEMRVIEVIASQLEDEDILGIINN